MQPGHEAQQVVAVKLRRVTGHEAVGKVDVAPQLGFVAQTAPRLADGDGAHEAARGREPRQDQRDEDRVVNLARGSDVVRECDGYKGGPRRVGES